MPKAVVIIPTYNEIDNISTVIEKVLNLSENFDILVVDDNSPDGTAEVVKGFVSKYSNRVFLEIKNIKEGLGKAYTLGFSWAMERNYDYIFQMDADLSHDPKDVPKLVEELKENDLNGVAAYAANSFLFNRAPVDLCISVAIISPTP